MKLIHSTNPVTTLSTLRWDIWIHADMRFRLLYYQGTEVTHLAELKQIKAK